MQNDHAGDDERDPEQARRRKRVGVGYWTPLAALLGKRADKHGRYDLVDFYELRHRAAWWMHVELAMPERLVAVQLGHTDGGKLVRELYGHGDHGAVAEIDRYLDTESNVVPLRATA